MATKKPRLTITLEPHTYHVVSTLAGLQGQSRSKVITDLLDTVTPVLERTCHILEMANKASSSVNNDLKDSMERSEAKLQAMMNDAMGQLDIFAEALSRPPTSADESEPKAGTADRPESRSDDTLPPHSNTGVTIVDNSKTSKKNKH
jgi:hypothetical protein